MKKTFLATVALLCWPFAAQAGEAQHPREMHWPFDGPSGKFDRQSAQRGFQVYKEVCAACHGLKRVSFRNLSEIGFSEAEIKALAAGYEVTDGPNDDGEMFQRPGRPSDPFPSPFPNEKAAAAANNGAPPPDLSLMIKARENGANYVYSLLTGYAAPPAEVKMNEGSHYNPYFPGGQIAMAPPLSDGRVEYGDGTPATADQMARDVVNFLQWAAEPEMERRKRMGFMALIYLAGLTVLLYLAKKRVWKKLH